MLRLALVACLVAVAVASNTHCNQYHSGYMLNQCNKCASYQKADYICRPRKSHFTNNAYEVGANPHAPRGYGYGHQPAYYGPYTDGQYYQAHDDPACYWQCDEYGQAFAKPCPYGQNFDAYSQVCVAGPGNTHGSPHGGYGNNRGGYGNPHDSYDNNRGGYGAPHRSGYGDPHRNTGYGNTHKDGYGTPTYYS